MSEGDELIVHFAAPPVVEVVAGVAFAWSSPETGALMAAFWKERLREHFPQVDQQPPYVPPIEHFPPSLQSSNLLFELNSGFPETRLLASTIDRQELIQLQPGWFACNWRKVLPTDEYDHWPKRRAAFTRWYSELEEFFAEASANPPKVTQCEVTYVNHIQPNKVWRNHAEFDQIFAASLGVARAGQLEQLTAQAQFSLVKDRVPYGRLHVKILPAYAKDGQTPLYVFELTARCVSAGSSMPTIDLLDLSRAAVVSAFLDLTTSSIQAEWQKGGI